MTLRISHADLTDAQLHAFLTAHLADLAPTAPPESRHALDLAALGAPGVQLWVGHRAGVLVATGALSSISADHEELKSMRTDPAVRGEGIASAMLAHLIADARSRGVERLSLETGSVGFFTPARRLYASAGFVPCGPFGSYVADPNSVFMTVEL
ncbi:GNAT family N-acetyltransferase [Leucobacter musarum]|uniref:GNAT family N-acetyltransferase n=1 Tax=Leucobacter musarum TaxID=1930747 RepID=UPI0006A7AA31